MYVSEPLNRAYTPSLNLLIAPKPRQSMSGSVACILDEFLDFSRLEESLESQCVDVYIYTPEHSSYVFHSSMYHMSDEAD